MIILFDKQIVDGKPNKLKEEIRLVYTFDKPIS